MFEGKDRRKKEEKNNYPIRLDLDTKLCFMTAFIKGTGPDDLTVDQAIEIAIEISQKVRPQANRLRREGEQERQKAA
jgi:hypothetical protein